VNKETGETTIEPAHEALLRRWGLLEGWLAEDAGLLAVMDGIKRASRDWAANNKRPAWLAHSEDRLLAAERLIARPDLAANLEATDREYLAACRKMERAGITRRRRVVALFSVLALALVTFIALGYSGFLDRLFLEGRVNWLRNSIREAGIKVGDTIAECDLGCPEMILIPAGKFMMGSSGGPDFDKSEQPQHAVTIAHPFLVSKFEITFAEWDECLREGGCSYRPNDEKWGRETRAVANVSARDAEQYLAWLSTKAGVTYRLPSEAEWEFAARAGTTTEYFWGNDIGGNRANCNGCQSKWDWEIAPVGSFAANSWGLYDMHGNVSEWVADIWHDNYQGAPSDGSAWIKDGDSASADLSPN
jgi:formylglycine-generating enzyme required for sulfatase activity